MLAQEIVRLLQTSDALDAETIPLELQNFDFVPYLLSAVPIAGPIMGVQLVHEVGHRIAARLKGVCPCCPAGAAMQSVLPSCTGMHYREESGASLQRDFQMCTESRGLHLG